VIYVRIYNIVKIVVGHTLNKELSISS